MEFTANEIFEAVASMRTNLRREYLYLILNMIPPRCSGVESLNQMYQFHFPGSGSCYILMLRANDKAQSGAASDADMDAAEALLRFGLGSCTQELETLRQGTVIYAVAATQEPAEEHLNRLASLLRKIRAECSPAACEWTMGVGKFVKNIDQLGDSLSSAEHAIKFSVVEGTGRLYDGNHARAVYEGGLMLMSSADQAKLRNLILKLDGDAVQECLRGMFSDRMAQIKEYPILAYMLSRQILESALQALRDNMPVDRKTFQMGEELSRRSGEPCTLHQLIAYTSEGVLRLLEQHRLYTEQGASKPVWIAMNYIQEHYAEAISLKDVAKAADRNPQYISATFSKECGFTIFDYITSLRIERAKQLLRTTDRSVEAISTEIGYSDPKYFSRLFSRMEGMAPSKYRSGHAG